MKKIIATVLAMVMALALCTTAFAATTAYVATSVGAETKIVSQTDEKTVTLEKFATGSASAKTFDTYKLWVTDTKTGAKTEVADGSGALGQLWIAVSDACDYVYVNGNSVTYLVKAINNETWDDTAKIMTVEKAATVDKATCGSFWSVTGGSAVSYDGKAYDATKTLDTANGKILNVDGKVAFINTAATATGVAEKKHDFKVDTATVNGEVTVTKVSCGDCKATFEFVLGSATDATLKFGAGNYTKVTVNNEDYTIDEDTLYVKTTGSNTVTPDNGKDSPKTFDAGIAMYVGMALTSVAGSAVVIGKKKEF